MCQRKVTRSTGMTAHMHMTRLQHFIKYRVSTQTYAWSLLETGFSEVFTRSEWMRLWDHILTNQPSWLLMAVVAYSLINRGPLLDCYEMEAFKQFYR